MRMSCFNLQLMAHLEMTHVKSLELSWLFVNGLQDTKSEQDGEYANPEQITMNSTEIY